MKIQIPKYFAAVMLALALPSESALRADEFGNLNTIPAEVRAQWDADKAAYKAEMEKKKAEVLAQKERINKSWGDLLKQREPLDPEQKKQFTKPLRDLADEWDKAQKDYYALRRSGLQALGQKYKSYEDIGKVIGNEIADIDQSVKGLAEKYKENIGEIEGAGGVKLLGIEAAGGIK